MNLLRKKLSKISLSNAIMLGLFLGIISGLFFGNMISFQSYMGKGFIGLLQMTILPYIVVSLISGIGNLTIEKARLLLLKGGLRIIIWGIISFAVLFSMVMISPSWSSASFFSSSII